MFNINSSNKSREVQVLEVLLIIILVTHTVKFWGTNLEYT